MRSSTIVSLSSFKYVAADASVSFASSANFARSVTTSRRSQENVIVTSNAACGSATSRYATLLPYFASVPIAGVPLSNFSPEIFCAALSCGTGSHTRSFFAPAGTSLTCATYEMSNFRVSPVFRNAASGIIGGAPGAARATRQTANDAVENAATSVRRDTVDSFRSGHDWDASRRDEPRGTRDHRTGPVRQPSASG